MRNFRLHANPFAPNPVPVSDGQPAMTLSTHLVLATDLDGTLIAGTQQARRRVRNLFSGGLPGAKLVYVSGRALESIMPLLSDSALPQPDYIIADVGATVGHGDLRPVAPLHHEIAARGPGPQAILQQRVRLPLLRRQTVPQQRRCSFLVNEGGITDELRAVVEALDCDLPFSAGRYLDVLPRGISKGATLRRLALAEGFDMDSIVVAGDTLNDLSMYTAGFKGIVVGGAEPDAGQPGSGRFRAACAGRYQEISKVEGGAFGAGGVTLVNIITPAAPGMEIYENLRIEVDRIVGRINGRFSTLEWTPVRYYAALCCVRCPRHYVLRRRSGPWRPGPASWAAKMARTIWAVTAKQQEYQRGFKSVRPLAA